MFETIFISELNTISTDKALIESLWNEINVCYNEPGRHYHNLLHLDHLIDQLNGCRDDIGDWQTIIFSVAYHDIIYDVRRQDNEEKSAELAIERLNSLHLPGSVKESCKQQILATKHHQHALSNDCDLFTDADLSVLGTDHEAYRIYSQRIRREYSLYTDDLYNAGRVKVLKHFLEMPAIYKTHFFAAKYEQQARQNIEWELAKLTH